MRYRRRVSAGRISGRAGTPTRHGSSFEGSCAAHAELAFDDPVAHRRSVLGHRPFADPGRRGSRPTRARATIPKRRIRHPRPRLRRAASRAPGRSSRPSSPSRRLSSRSRRRSSRVFESVQECSRVLISLKMYHTVCVVETCSNDPRRGAPKRRGGHGSIGASHARAGAPALPSSFSGAQWNIHHPGSTVSSGITKPSTGTIPASSSTTRAVTKCLYAATET